MFKKLDLSSSNNNLNRELKMFDSSHLGFLPHENNDRLGILEPVVRTTLLVHDVPYKISLKLINPNFDYKTLCYHIYDTLPLNTLQ